MTELDVADTAGRVDVQKLRDLSGTLIFTSWE